MMKVCKKGDFSLKYLFKDYSDWVLIVEPCSVVFNSVVYDPKDFKLDVFLHVIRSYFWKEWVDHFEDFSYHEAFSFLADNDIYMLFGKVVKVK